MKHKVDSVSIVWPSQYMSRADVHIRRGIHWYRVHTNVRDELACTLLRLVQEKGWRVWWPAHNHIEAR